MQSWLRVLQHPPYPPSPVFIRLSSELCAPRLVNKQVGTSGGVPTECTGGRTHYLPVVPFLAPCSSKSPAEASGTSSQHPLLSTKVESGLWQPKGGKVESTLVRHVCGFGFAMECNQG
ncbi:hypothetical protein AAFF_G00292250 [Aldrovandia affinis]|uniref:Uncharacterized protein n=1 Tax=Aldrovandia affinis TaxID=143900 RepID=A0AAD7WSP9_9TELE|nr:hypothetical protein AAFF_G00292250 [Aldrovandia affinis]